MNWKKTLMYGSFAAGAVLFFTGRRSAGLVATGVGIATLAADNPEKFQELWRRMPDYLDKGVKLVDKGVKLVDMATTFLDRMAEQEGDMLLADGGND
jgi:hypothetical protein